MFLECLFCTSLCRNDTHPPWCIPISSIIQFLCGLEQAGMVLSKPPNHEFTSNEINFQKRFESFYQIHQPPVLRYDDFVQGSDYSSIDAKLLISSTMDLFKDCRVQWTKLKKMLEDKTIEMDYSCITMDDINNGIKVCVTNSLHLLKLSKFILEKKEGDNLPVVSKNAVTFQFDIDAHYCCIHVHL